MIWFIGYFLIAGIVIFGFRIVQEKVDPCSSSGFIALIWGVVWPVGIPVYGALLAAEWFVKKESKS